MVLTHLIIRIIEKNSRISAFSRLETSFCRARSRKNENVAMKSIMFTTPNIKFNLDGALKKRIVISTVNQALQTHSM